MEMLGRLAKFCLESVAPKTSAWRFMDGVELTTPSGKSPSSIENAMHTWALSPARSWDWLQTRTTLDWRPEQVELLQRLDRLRSDAIGLLEGGTGIGKTRAMAFHAHAASAQRRTVIAVPTLAIGAQWQETWKLFCDQPMEMVWGRSNYSEDEALAEDLQEQALESASQAPAVLCTHQMIPKVLERSGTPSHLYVDEAHLLHASLASLAGVFMPVAAAGKWLVRWCDQQLPNSGEEVEVELSGRMREIIIHRLLPSQRHAEPWQVSVLGRPNGAPVIWLRHENSIDTVLAKLWQSTQQAVLFSGTLSWQTGTGIRSVQHNLRRLQIPVARAQDLGRVRAAWRDDGVTVLRPMPRLGSDNRQFLGAFRGREDHWWPEAAQALTELRARPGKTLVLATSYADIEGIALALASNSTGIVFADKATPMAEQINALKAPDKWCWLATGAAWTGMDAIGVFKRVVILKLPLPDPIAMARMAHPMDAVMDAVSRFKQGVGRLVRGAGGEGLEIIVLDGRANDPSPRWRNICQPFLQVLGEDFEHHCVLDFLPQERSEAKCADLNGDNLLLSSASPEVKRKKKAQR